MNIPAFLDHIRGDFFPVVQAVTCYPRDPKRYIEVLDRVQAMTTPNIMHLLNCAVQQLGDDEIYLEVGAWRGGTFIGALLGNTAHGIAIDDDSMAGIETNDTDGRRNSDVWRENVEAFGLTEQSTFINGSVPAVWETFSAPPVGVYLFDGDKSSTGAVLDGLTGLVPHLAKQALIILDDANTPAIRQAAHEFLHHNRTRACALLDLSAPQNGWVAGWWNGLMLIGWGVMVQ